MMEIKPGTKKIILASLGGILLGVKDDIDAYWQTINGDIFAVDWSLVIGTAVSSLYDAVFVVAGLLWALYTKTPMEDAQQSVPAEPPDLRPPQRPLTPPVPVERVDETDLFTADDYEAPKPVPEPVSHYLRADLECRGMTCDCTFPGMSKGVMAIAEEVWRVFGVQVVNSGYRCPVHNAEVPGSSNASYHMKARALDLKPAAKGVTPKMVYDYLCERYPNRFGFGLYNTMVHIDDRGPGLYARKEGPNEAWHQYEIEEPQEGSVGMIL